MKPEPSIRNTWCGAAEGAGFGSEITAVAMSFMRGSLKYFTATVRQPDAGSRCPWVGSGRAGLARRGAFLRPLLARLVRRRHRDADLGRHPARHPRADELPRAI